MFSSSVRLARFTRTTESAIIRPTLQKRCVFDFISTGGRSSVSGVVATVFGSTGFLSRYIVCGLGKIGSQVIVPYRGEEASYNHLKVMGDLGQIVPMKWDIRDKESIRRACKYSNVIINASGTKWDTRNFNMKDVHVDGARMIAEVAEEMGIERFIHVSACGLAEDPSDWAKTKLAGEEAVRKACSSAIIIRPSTLWGLQDDFMVKYAQMMRYWPVYPIIHPNKLWQPVYVNDVAQAIINSLKDKDNVGKTFELAGPDIMSTAQFSDWLALVLKLQDTKYRVEISDELLWHMGYWLGQHRNPRFTLDSIKRSTDIVASLKYPGLSALDVVPNKMNSPLGISFIHVFRTPSRFTDLTTDLEEIPELKGSVKAGIPVY